MTRFCARCGITESENNPILTYLCIDCYIKEKGIDLVPKTINIKICGKCGSVKVEDKWLTPDEYGSDIKILVSYKIQDSIDKPEYFSELSVENINIHGEHDNYYIESIIRGKVLGNSFRKKYRSLLKINKSLCPTCLKIQGKAYDATVQIRGLPKINRELEDKLYREITSKVPNIIRSYIVEIETVRNGIDIKLTSREAAYALADYLQRRYGGYKVISNENVKRDRSGKITSKKTISLRIISIEPGEYLNIDGKPYIVESIYSDHVVLRGRDGRKISISYSDIYRSWGRKKRSSKI